MFVGIGGPAKLQKLQRVKIQRLLWQRFEAQGCITSFKLLYELCILHLATARLLCFNSEAVDHFVVGTQPAGSQALSGQLGSAFLRGV